MKAIVDRDACGGCGLCADVSPEVFAMDGDIARVLVDPVPQDATVSCSEAAEGCPVDAITIEE